MFVLQPADTIHAFRSASWHLLRTARPDIAPSWRSWLVTEGSLTKRLIRASQGDFRLQVLNQYWGTAWPSEQVVLGLESRQQVLIREIAMICQGQIWVVARSLMPPRTLTGPRRRLKSLGRTPLGRYLFSQPSLRRSPMEVAPLVSEPGMIHCWGRRSIFYLAEHPLLVSEFFLPAILDAQESRRPVSR